MKKIISVLLTICLIVCMIPVGANAAENQANALKMKERRYVSFGTYPQRRIDSNQYAEWHQLFNVETKKDSNVITYDGKKYYFRGEGGDTVYYEIEPIEWEIIGSSGDCYELMSNRILVLKPFTETVITGNPGSHWFDGSLRTWLNDTFLNSAFTKEEQKDIADTVNKTEHITYDQWSGKDKNKTPTITSSTEKVYLPTKEYCESQSPIENIAYSTQYANAKEPITSYWTLNEEVWWYGETRHNLVSTNGEIGHYWRTWDRGVRPVIRVKKTSKFLQTVSYNVSFRKSGKKTTITEDELYRNYPEYLNNETILTKQCKKATDDIMETLAARGGTVFGINTRDALAALKSEMMDSSLKYEALLEEWLSGEGNAYETMEEKLDEELALELIQAISTSNGESLEIVNELSDELKPALKNMGKIAETTREMEAQKMAEQIYQSFVSNPMENISLADIKYNDIYKTCKKLNEKGTWDTLSRVFKDCGIVLNVAEAAVFIYHELILNKELVRLLFNATEGSERIHNGFGRIYQKQVDYSNKNIEDVLNIIIEKEMPVLAQEMASKGEKKLLEYVVGGTQAGTLFFTNCFYFIVGTLVQSPTIDETSKAWTTMVYAKELGLSLSEHARAFVDSKGKDEVSLDDNGVPIWKSREYAKYEYEMLFRAYVACINNAYQYTSVVVSKDKLKSQELKDQIKKMDKTMGRYMSANIHYESYIDSCIKNVTSEINLQKSPKNSKATMVPYQVTTLSLHNNDEFSYDIPARPDNRMLYRVEGGIPEGAAFVTIPNSVTEIGEKAFANNTKLIAVFGGKNIKKIESKAFAGCSNLKYIELSRTIEEIADDAFQGINSVTGFAEPGSVAESFLKANSNMELQNDDRSIDSIKILTKPKANSKTLSVADDFDKTGISIKVTYKDKTSEEITDSEKIGCAIIGKTPGSNKTIVYYGGASTTYYTTLENAQLSYRVLYENEVGEQIYKSKIITGKMGDDVTLDAPEIRGYKVDQNSLKAKLGINKFIKVVYKDNRIDIGNTKVQYDKNIVYSKKYIPNVTVLYNGQQLKKGVDYTLDYDFPMTNGDHAIALLGIGDYKGAVPLDVTVSGAPESEKYSDVADGKWFTEAVYYCRNKGYMAGKGKNIFDPNGTVTRATITQVLYAMEGKPSRIQSYGFKDVASGRWYTDSVNWAASVGIVAGYSKEKFGPNDPITRQQMAAIMYQYAKYKKYDTKASGDISKFKDVGSVTKYAVEPMKWAVGHNIISGTKVGLEPKGTATRAQIAVILQAFDKNIKRQ